MFLLERSSWKKEWLDGLIDLHVHAAPDVFERPFDEVEVTRRAKRAGYKAIMFKCHHTANADRAYLIKKMVRGIEVFGGIVLNHAVGGINPAAVAAAVQLGAKEVWFPTLDSAHHRRILGSGIPGIATPSKLARVSERLPGITILEEDQKLRPEVEEVLDLVTSSGVILGTGHLSKEEIFALLRKTQGSNRIRVLVTHPEWLPNKWDLEDIERMCELGAYLELCYASVVSPRLRQSAEHVFDMIKRVGSEHIVLASDLGQVYNPHPIEGMGQFLGKMRSLGVELEELERMTKDNPARLLSI